VLADADAQLTASATVGTHGVDLLFTPWRYRYVTKQTPQDGCVFCHKAALPDDEALIVHRGRLAYVVLNRYPYAPGHVMTVPFDHVATMEDCREEVFLEMMTLARRTALVIKRAYRAPGLNVGMNIGESAGAGVAQHLHLHLLPRWPGDVNFMTTIGETRVIAEDLPSTLAKLRAHWEEDRADV
jgi:ATP adenylyltransferase